MSKLKNYTSQIPEHRSISEIELVLFALGATEIRQAEAAEVLHALHAVRERKKAVVLAHEGRTTFARRGQEVRGQLLILWFAMAIFVCCVLLLCRALVKM